MRIRLDGIVYEISGTESASTFRVVPVDADIEVSVEVAARLFAVTRGISFILAQDATIVSSAEDALSVARGVGNRIAQIEALAGFTADAAIALASAGLGKVLTAAGVFAQAKGAAESLNVFSDGVEILTILRKGLIEGQATQDEAVFALLEVFLQLAKDYSDIFVDTQASLLSYNDGVVIDADAVFEAYDAIGVFTNLSTQISKSALDTGGIRNWLNLSPVDRYLKAAFTLKDAVVESFEQLASGFLSPSTAAKTVDPFVGAGVGTIEALVKLATVAEPADLSVEQSNTLSATLINLLTPSFESLQSDKLLDGFAQLLLESNPAWSDGNETVADATPLAFIDNKIEMEGIVGSVDAADVFSLEIAEPEQLFFDYAAREGGVVVRLLDSNGETIELVYGYTPQLEPGTYNVVASYQPDAFGSAPFEFL
ncbi:MAG: hypothetical protein AAFP20_24620, partial [Cyanobacteria bacterium J06614_10]